VWQTIQRYVQTIIDTRKPKPAQASALVTIDDRHSVEDVVANLLPLACAMLSDVDLVHKVSKTLRYEGDIVDDARTSYAQILEQVFVLSEVCKSSKRCQQPFPPPGISLR